MWKELPVALNRRRPRTAFKTALKAERERTGDGENDVSTRKIVHLITVEISLSLQEFGVAAIDLALVVSCALSAF